MKMWYPLDLRFDRDLSGNILRISSCYHYRAISGRTLPLLHLTLYFPKFNEVIFQRTWMQNNLFIHNFYKTLIQNPMSCNTYLLRYFHYKMSPNCFCSPVQWTNSLWIVLEIETILLFEKFLIYNIQSLYIWFFFIQLGFPQNSHKALFQMLQTMNDSAVK